MEDGLFESKKPSQHGIFAFLQAALPIMFVLFILAKTKEFSLKIQIINRFPLVCRLLILRFANKKGGAVSNQMFKHIHKRKRG